MVILVSARRLIGSVIPSPWGARWALLAVECFGGSTAENLSGNRSDRQHLGWGCLGTRALWRKLYVLGHAFGLCPIRFKEKSSSSSFPPGIRSSTTSLEKGGLTACLQAVGCRDSPHLFWGDEMRVGLMGCVRRVWALVGIKVTQAVEYTREWAYLHLAVNGLKGKLMWAWSDNMKAESIVPVVKQWSRQRVKLLVWDRARGHRGPLYDTVRLQRIEQSPYSPELNPPECVFEYLRAAVEGKVYGTLAAKKEAIETALYQLAASPDKVKQMTGWQWIRDAIGALDVEYMALK